ncbi:MAG: DUF2318 domain-containing protein [Desulfovibrionaceae bacterium]|nr:DUF2318 domain-containing protein [Desulfovibrionaceae bacterium]
MRTTYIFVLLITLLTAAPAWAFLGFGTSEQKAVAKDGLVTLDTSTLSTGQAKHYQYREGNTRIRFFLLKDHQGAVRAALNACDVCWKEGKGYVLSDGNMLCVNCGMKFALNRIGLVKGGCNPHPIAFSLDGATFTVAVDELLSGAQFFPENGK